MTESTATATPPATDGETGNTAAVLETGGVATASPGGPAPDQVPASVAQEPDADATVFLAWDTAGEYLLVTTMGSSGCPNAINRVVQTGDQILELSTSNSEAALLGTSVVQTCTADLAPFTSSVVVPAGIVRTEPLRVIVEGREIVVPPQS